MSRPITFAVLLSVALSLLLTVGVCVWKPPANPPGVPEPELSKPDPELTSRLASIQASTGAKQAVARNLVAGRLDLLAAAAATRQVDRGSPHFQWEAFRQATPNMTDEERHCREAIGWVRTVLDDDAHPRVRELEEELECYLSQGVLQLPDGK